MIIIAALLCANPGVIASMDKTNDTIIMVDSIHSNERNEANWLSCMVDFSRNGNPIWEYSEDVCGAL